MLLQWRNRSARRTYKQLLVQDMRRLWVQTSPGALFGSQKISRYYYVLQTAFWHVRMAEWSKAPDSRLLPCSWIGSTYEREFWSSTEGMGSNPIPDNRFYTFLYVFGQLKREHATFWIPSQMINCKWHISSVQPPTSPPPPLDLVFENRCNMNVYNHTMLNTPDLVWSLQLSNIGLS